MELYFSKIIIIVSKILFYLRKNLVCELFIGNEFSNTETSNGSLGGKLMNASVGKKFRSQLDILLAKLRKTVNSRTKPSSENFMSIISKL